MIRAATPTGRIGSIDDIANLALFILSEAGTNLTAPSSCPMAGYVLTSRFARLEPAPKSWSQSRKSNRAPSLAVREPTERNRLPTILVFSAAMERLKTVSPPGEELDGTSPSCGPIACMFILALGVCAQAQEVGSRVPAGSVDSRRLAAGVSRAGRTTPRSGAGRFAIRQAAARVFSTGSARHSRKRKTPTARSTPTGPPSRRPTPSSRRAGSSLSRGLPITASKAPRR